MPNQDRYGTPDHRQMSPKPVSQEKASRRSCHNCCRRPRTAALLRHSCRGCATACRHPAAGRITFVISRHSSIGCTSKASLRSMKIHSVKGSTQTPLSLDDSKSKETRKVESDYCWMVVFLTGKHGPTACLALSEWGIKSPVTTIVV